MFLRVLRHMPQSQRAHFIIRTRVIAAIGNIRPYSPISFQPHPAPFSHNFSSTTRVRAVEDPDAFISGFKNTSLFKKLADKPEALQALDRFSKLLRKAGIDTTSGKQPSKMQLINLASNAEFRESARNVAEELQKAGVDLHSREVMEEVMNLKNKLLGGNDSDGSKS